MGKRKKEPSILDLTWDDLEEWAGAKIVSRGRSYKNAVEDLRRTPDGGCVAWVRGTKRYMTLAGLGKSGELECYCTCPYTWGPCKHAVAVILVSLDAMKEERDVPEVDAADERLQLLPGIRRGHPLEDWEMEEGEDAGDLEDEFRVEAQELGQRETGGVGRKRYGRTGEVKRAKSLREYLDGFSRQALTDLVLELAEHHPGVREALGDRVQLQSGRVGEMAASIRREIEQLSSEPGWTSHWSAEGYIPDYSRVRERMRALLDGGHADAVVSLAEDLLQLGTRQVEMSHDEGETGWEIGNCMTVVFDALARSSLAPADRLLWAIDAYLADEYGILDTAGDPLSDCEATKQDWSLVADTLAKRLDQMSTPAKNGEDHSFSRSYHRQQVMRWLIEALENAGRKREVIPLLEREAPVTKCYNELVARLISARRREDAERWAKEGFEKTIEIWPGIASSLAETLTDLAAREKDWHKVAAYRASAFFNQPGVSRYAALEKASRKAGCWPDVRAAVLHYLETGHRPDIRPKNKSPRARAKGHAKARSGQRATRTPSSALPWPLPPTGLPTPADEPRWRTFPDTNVLIDIAIKEKRTDDVVKWHETAGKRSELWGSPNDDKVAKAVQKTHPEVALKLWRELADREIARVKPAAYQVAKAYLRKMRAVYHREKRLAEWQAYLAKLRESNKRRPRMIDVLDSLEGKRIVDGY